MEKLFLPVNISPTKVVKDRYGAKIEQDAQQEALNEVFTEALKVVEKDANLVVGEPQITKYGNIVLT